MNSFDLNWYGEEVERTVDMAIQIAVENGAEDVLKEAKKRCPVGNVTKEAQDYKARRPGSLKKSGRTKSFKKKGVIGTYVKFGGKVVNGVDTYYAPFVELGTPGTVMKVSKTGGTTKREPVTANPFLRTALKITKGKIKAKFRNKLK